MLTFDESAHRYELDGHELPSVTSVLDPFTGLDYVNRDVLEAAQLLGTRVHLAVHLWNTEQMEYCPDDVRPYRDGWRDFLAESGAVVTDSELRVYSDKHRYAGTLDSILYWKGRKCVVDVKSGSVVPKTVGPQCAAYVQAYNEMHGTRLRSRRCIHLRPSGTYKVHKLEDARDFNIFQAALIMHRWHKGEL